MYYIVGACLFLPLRILFGTERADRIHGALVFDHQHDPASTVREERRRHELADPIPGGRAWRGVLAEIVSVPLGEGPEPRTPDLSDIPHGIFSRFRHGSPPVYLKVARCGRRCGGHVMRGILTLAPREFDAVLNAQPGRLRAWDFADDV
jgi:hypothetical protein